MGEIAHQLRILHPRNLSFQSEGEIKNFSDKQKLRVYIASGYGLQEMLKEFFKEKGNNIVRNVDLHKIRKGIEERMFLCQRPSFGSEKHVLSWYSLECFIFCKSSCISKDKRENGFSELDNSAPTILTSNE